MRIKNIQSKIGTTKYSLLVLSSLVVFGFSVKLKKCSFVSSEIKFLGNKLEEENFLTITIKFHD